MLMIVMSYFLGDDGSFHGRNFVERVYNFGCSHY